MKTSQKQNPLLIYDGASGARTTGILLLCILLYSCDSTPQLPRLTSGSVILAFGDSLTDGAGVEKSASYPVVLAALIGRDVVNAGVSGELSAQGLKRLPKLLDKHKPSLLILCHGGNDILRKKDLAETAEHLTAMIRLAKTRNIPVILLGVPKPGLFLSAVDFYEQVARTTGVVFMDDLIADVLSKNALKSDMVHPNKQGYRIIAEQIAALLRDAGAI